MWLFRVLFAFDALFLAALAFFFLEGLQYGPSAEATGIWLPILLVPSAILACGWILRDKGRTGAASLLLGLLALPPLLFISFYGLLFATGASWH